MVKEQIRIPARYERCSLDRFEPVTLSQHRAHQAALRFVEKYPHVTRGLFFTGPAGVGKTHLAAGIILELARHYWDDLLFVDFTAMLDGLSGWGPAAAKPDLNTQCISEAGLLVLDDFGAGAPTPANVDFVKQLLQSRWNHRKPTIFTAAAVRCRELFHDAAPMTVSQPESFLRALSTPARIRLLGGVRLLLVTGQDHRATEALGRGLFH